MDLSDAVGYADTYDYRGLIDSLAASLKPVNVHPGVSWNAEVLRNSIAMLDAIQSTLAQTATDAKDQMKSFVDLFEGSQWRDNAAILQNVIAGIEPNSDIRRQRLAFLLNLGGALITLISSSSLNVNYQADDASADDLDLQRLMVQYDPDMLEKYWSARQGEVLTRQGEITSKLMQFLSKVSSHSKMCEI